MVVVLVAMTLFAGRLVQLQSTDASKLAEQALRSRLVTTTLPATRGEITDVNGTPLAESVERYNVFVNQKQVADYKRWTGGVSQNVTVADAVARLAGVLGQPVDQVTRAVTGTRGFNYVDKQVTPEMWRAVQNLHIPWVDAERTSQRLYPQGAVAGNIIGFMSGDGRALAGLELSENARLSGKDGWQRYERGADSVLIPMGENEKVAARDGETVELTLDADLQWYAQRAIAQRVQDVGAEWGEVTVQDREGHILALAEAPTVDPNDPAKSSAADRGIRTLWDVYEPGSTAKVITASAAIQEGVVAPDSKFSVPEHYTTPNGQVIDDAEPHGVERLTFAGILGQSSNTGTTMVGEKLTPAQRYEYLRKFGIGQRTGLEYPGESAGLLASWQKWDGRQQYTVLFGQGFALTALQQSQVYVTLANDGVRPQPHLISAYVDPDGTRHPVAAGAGTRVVSAETARTVRQMMEGVVDQGTGSAASIPGYRVAGKTGTAQAPDGHGGYSGYTASFVGMAPADDPQLIVSVTVQRPQKGHFGAEISAPVFKDVMSYALKARDVPPTGTAPAQLPATW